CHRPSRWRPAVGWIRERVSCRLPLSDALWRRASARDPFVHERQQLVRWLQPDVSESGPQCAANQHAESAALKHDECVFVGLVVSGIGYDAVVGTLSEYFLNRIALIEPAPAKLDASVERAQNEPGLFGQRVPSFEGLLSEFFNLIGIETSPV